MQEIKQIEAQQVNQVSLKEIILKLQEWWKYLLSKWLVIVIAGIAGAGLGVTYGFLEHKEYVAELTFLLEDSKSGGPLAAYAGLASQFGIDLGGMSSSGVFEGDNVLEFLKSRLMIEKTLLSPVKSGGQKTLADLYIETYEFDKKWENKPKLNKLHFPVGLARAKFTLLQDSILNVLQERVVKKNLLIEKPDKKLSFISVECTSLNEDFSKSFTERLVKEATDFYVSTKIKRSQVNVDKLQVTADSLEILLNRKTYSVAAAKDVNQNPARQVATVESEVGARDKMVLQTIYGEVIKNLEISKMTMAQETPVVQIVDSPILPLEVKRLGKLKGLIIGGFLGGFFTVLWLAMKRIYEQIML
ncbi:hypothetical protein [Chitinophaga sp. GbtcB8]|uniref:hypothetical protein n=1 Tax=Chitinophaga sp. GbtcB8 TaxID=2824753 RepID=UPI001C2F2749|nr:hypothetical protein [Chitinophaga sp. GbtcB8]